MVDLRTGVIVRTRSAFDRLARPVRRGSRTVHLTPDTGIGFGNLLYLLFDAHRKQADGMDYRVLVQPPLRHWLEVMPTAREQLTVERARAFDRREEWAFRLADQFGVDFDAGQLRAFVQDCLLGPLVRPESDKGQVVVNVRRGDYYSDPRVRGTHGFDVLAYLRLAMSLMQEHSPFDKAVVVSDDIPWCRARVDEVLRPFCSTIDYAPSTESPQDNFRRVAGARRLVGTNSTFSYWGGYVSSVLHADASTVVMPRFHARLPEGWPARQLDPAWLVVDEIPGGWDS